MHKFLCLECPDVSTAETLRRVLSDAEWHNTATGHDVMVEVKPSTIGEDLYLNDCGWVDGATLYAQARDTQR